MDKEEILSVTPLEEEPDIKPVKTNKSNKPANMYAGPLTLAINEEKEISKELLIFKEFIDGQGSMGVTFEELFDKIKQKTYYHEGSKVDRSKITHKLYQCKNNNVFTYVWMQTMANILDHELTITFIPKAEKTLAEATIDMEREGTEYQPDFSGYF